MRKMIFSYLLCAVLPMMAQVEFVHLQPERLPDLNIPRFSHDTFYANGELTVTGGHTTSFVPTPTAEYLKDGEWHVMQMAYPHDDGLCVPLRSGKVLLAGGYEKNLGVGQTIEAELYDPATHTFEGFGCLDRRRAHVSAVELPNGQVVVAGNWYHNDAIETYDGGMYFETVREVSIPRSFPYLFCTSDSDVMVVSGYWDNYGKVITSNIIDRLKSEPFRVPLLETWQPYLLPHAPRSDDSFIGNVEKGLFAYLLAVRDSAGRVAICEVRDTVFSLLPTASPVPMKYKEDSILYNTPVIVDRQSQRGYIMGSDTIGRTYILCVEYTKRPAPLTLYYTDPLPEAAGGIPVLTADGNLVTTGGIAHGGTYFTPTKAVWLFPVGSDPTAAETKGGMWWLWTILATLIVAVLFAYLIIYKRRKEGPETLIPNAPNADDSLILRIEDVMKEKQLYLNSNLKMSDVATLLGIHQNDVSASINSSKGCSFSQFVNGYRIEHAKRLLRQQPDMKMAHVAIESGFASDTSFFRTFKALTGMTPSEWIQQKSTDNL